MKVFTDNYNGVLDGIIAKLQERGEWTDNYHEADVFLLWQDVRGVQNGVARIAKKHLGKPVVVMQHGRGATRDYDAPNKFPLLADKILVWGEAEAERMRKLGYGDRVEVVGCPLFASLKPKNKERQGRNVLFAPVISSGEEPENILVYAALKKWESEKLIESIYEKYADLKKGWMSEDVQVVRSKRPDDQIIDKVFRREVVPRIPRAILYDRGLVNVKLTSVHDQFQYMAPVIGTSQGDANHAEQVTDLLRNIDAIVCLEEGTMQLLACALDIPVIHVDIFKYGNYGGVQDYDSVEKISTGAVYRTTNLSKVGDLLDQALKNPQELRRQRIAVAEREGGAHLGDPAENAIRALESVARREAVVA